MSILGKSWTGNKRQTSKFLKILLLSAIIVALMTIASLVAGADVFINSRSGNLILNTTGIERARITSGGLFGIGTKTPTDTLTVVGSLVTMGSLNATYINASKITVGSIDVQTVNAVFNLINYSAEYSSTGWDKENSSDFHGQQNASILLVQNFTNIFESAFKIVNGTQLPFSSFQLSNVSNNTLTKDNNASIALWNISSGSTNNYLYPRNANITLRIGTTNIGLSNDTLVVLGSVAVYGSLNATYINATKILVGTNDVQTVNAVFNLVNYSAEYSSTGFDRENVSEYLGGSDINASIIKRNNLSAIFEAAFNKVNGSQLAFSNYTRENFTAHYEEQAYFKIVNGTQLPFSSFQLSNVSNNTLTKDNNASIALWNTTGSNVYLRDITANVGVGTPVPDNRMTIIGNEIQYASPASALHINVSDDFNTSVVNAVTIDHVLKNPLNSTGGVGVSILFRASDNVSQMSNIGNITAILYNSSNGSQLSAITFSTRTGDTGDGSFGHLIERMRIDGNGNVGINTTKPMATLHVAGNANITGELYVLGSIYGIIGAGNISGSLKDSQVDNDITIQTTSDLTVGGGYSSGGITLWASGDNTGSGFFANDILVDGEVISVNDVTINQSFIPTRDKFSILGNSTNRWLDLQVINIKTYNESLVLNANVTVIGNISVDGNTFFVDSVNNKVGIGTYYPADTFSVIGSASVFGSLNATYINATEIRVGNKQPVQEEGNAFKIENGTRLSFSNFQLSNVSEYLGGSDINASIIKRNNLSAIFEAAFNLANYSAEYSATGFDNENFSAQVTGINSSLWNTTTGSTVNYLYPRNANSTIRIGTVNTSLSNDTLVVSGSVSVYGSLNATSINATKILVGTNDVQTVNAVFNKVNGSQLDFSSYQRTNFTSQYEEQAYFKIVNGTQLPFSAFTIENGTNLPFSNFRLENVSNNTLVRGDNASIALFNISGGNITLRDNNNNFTIKNNLFYADLTNHRIGLNTSFPSSFLSIIGSVNIDGSLNATSINASKITVNGQDAQTVNAVFNLINYSAEYSSTGFRYENGTKLPFSSYQTSNFTSQYESRADRFTLVNYSAEYSATGFDNENFSAQVTGINSSLWNTTTGSTVNYLYPRNANSTIRIGTVNTSLSNDTLVVSGSVSVYGSLNATSINATKILVGTNDAQTVNAVFNKVNGSQLDFSSYQRTNFTSQYEEQAYFKIVNGTQLPFSNFLLSNVSNNTLTKDNNASIALWNISYSGIYPSNATANVGIGTSSPSTKLQVIGGIISGGLRDSEYGLGYQYNRYTNNFTYPIWFRNSQSGFIATKDAFFRTNNDTIEIGMSEQIANYSQEGAILNGVMIRLQHGEGTAGQGVPKSIQFHTNNAERARFDENGKLIVWGGFNATFVNATKMMVGINDVQTVNAVFNKVNGSQLAFSNFLLENVSNNTLTKDNNASIALWNTTGSNVYLREQSNNVGIGTSTPNQKLVVNAGTISSGTGVTNFIGNASGGNINVILNNSNSAINTRAAYNLIFQDIGGNAVHSYFQAVLTDNTSGSAGTELRLINTQSGATAQAMTIDKSGNVGIRTTNPSYKLEVDNATDGRNVNFSNTFFVNGTNQSVIIGLKQGGTAGSSISTAELSLGGTYNAGTNMNGAKLWIGDYDNDGATMYPIYVEDENNLVDFWIKNSQTQSGTPTMYFKGSVGIGTTTPVYKLQVADATTASLNVSNVFFVDGQNNVASIGTMPNSGAVLLLNRTTSSQTVDLSISNLFNGLNPNIQFCGGQSGWCNYVFYNQTTSQIFIGQSAVSGVNPTIAIGNSIDATGSYTGRVGIRMSKPTKELDVNGSAVVRNTLNATNITSQTLNTVSSQGLVIAMNFNNASLVGTTALDSSRFNNHGVVVGTLPFLENASFNNGGTFNFTPNNYVQIPHDTDLNLEGNFTISVWYYNINDASEGVLGKGDASQVANSEYIFQAEDSANVFWLRGAWRAPNAATRALYGANNVWRHAAISYENETGILKWYVDGKLSDTSTSITGAYATTDTLAFHIGRAGTDGGYFDGNIDDVRIYKRILSDREINNLYEQKAEVPDATVSKRDVYVSSDGNVGIGTTSPGEKLHVSGGTSGNILLDNQGIIMGKDSGGTERYAFYPRWSNDATYIDGGDGGMYLRTSDTAQVTNIYLKTDGTVGIGTTSPSSTLHIEGNFTQTGKTNSSIGNFTIGQYNASCSGFRFGSNGGWILSCT